VYGDDEATRAHPEERLTHGTTHGRPGLQLVRLPADPVPVLVVSGELDVYEAPTFRAELSAMVEEGHERVVVDCMNMTFIDSAGLATLLDAARRLHARDGVLALRHVRPATRRLFEVAGVVDAVEFDG
jgi:anti-anti-sigma factor